MWSRRDSAADLAGLDAGPDTSRRSLLPGLLIGGGRVAIGAVFALDPLRSVRFLGVDTATASRITWLAQMTAARDMALGIGTVASTISGRGRRGWLLAGAACDTADALALAGALSRKQVAPVPAGAVLAAAIGAAAAAAAIAGRGGGPIVS